MERPSTDCLSRPALISQDSITQWYQSRHDPSSPRDIAHEAYLGALEYLKKELRGNDETHKILNSKTTIDDIKAVVDKAQEKYNALAKHKSARQWLRSFSSRIMYYGQVLDILAQHHPEYVALAWGSIKFVLMGILNHATLVTQLSKALAKIGDALQQTKLSAELYRTYTMKDAISRLYAHIILFLQQAIKWYNMSQAGRAIYCILKPFELSYKDTVDEIKLCVQTVNEIAGMAGRAELRDMHISIQMQQQQSRERDAKLHEMQAQLKDIRETIDDSTSRVLQVATCHKALTERIHVEVLNINPRIYDMQLSSILQVLKPQQSPEETLAKVQSLAKRVQMSNIPSRDSVDLLKSLGTWVSREESALFLVKVGVRAEAKAKEFAADVVKLLQPMPYGVIWNLSWIRSHGSVPSMTDMIKSLIFQALQHDPTLLHSHPEELNVMKFQSNHSEAEWISLLSQLFSRLSKCFIVVEAEDIFQAHRDILEWTTRFLVLFQNLVDQAETSGNQLKILVIGYGTTLSTLQAMPGKKNRIVSSIQRPQPVPPHLRRQFASRKTNLHLADWQTLKPKF